MPKLSVVIPVLNEETYLPKALDALIHQTVEDFEVLLVDGGSTDGSLDIARAACDKYVGFYLINGKFANRFEAMNRGLKAAEGDYVLFQSAKDFITDETVEKLLDTIAESEKKPDVLVFRKYLFGEGIQPHFDEYEDKLAPLPEAPKYEHLFLRALFLGNKCYRKAYLENRHIHFDVSNVFADALFVYQAFFLARHVMGCPYAFYEKQVFEAAGDPAGRHAPTKENLGAFCDMFSKIYALAAEAIAEDSGREADGEESYLQEVTYRWVCLLIERFYRYFWLMDDDTYADFAARYQQLAKTLDQEKQKKLGQFYSYIGAPLIFENRQSADYLCMLALSFPTAAEYAPFLDSLYRQSFPFFEVAVRKSVADAGVVSERYLAMPNMNVLDDADFFSEARRAAKSQMVLVVKDSYPLHLDAMKELCESHAPMFLRQSVFAKIRKTAKLKMTMKAKGLDI